MCNELATRWVRPPIMKCIYFFLDRLAVTVSVTFIVLATSHGQSLFFTQCLPSNQLIESNSWAFVLHVIVLLLVFEIKSTLFLVENVGKSMTRLGLLLHLAQALQIQHIIIIMHVNCFSRNGCSVCGMSSRSYIRRNK